MGIPETMIFVKEVREGSVIIDYTITVEPEYGLTKEELGYKQSEVFASGNLDLGAPILDLESSLGD
jgi:hypothetical protein